MFIKSLLIIALSSMFIGCASVPMESKERSAQLKQFNPPSQGNAGLYLYRAGGFGGALKKDIWVDDKCIGESAPNIFFYEEVAGNQEHKVSTESEFSPNDLMVNTESGKNYFIQQYIKMGVFVGGANLKLVDDAEGKRGLESLELAVKGKCGQ